MKHFFLILFLGFLFGLAANSFVLAAEENPKVENLLPKAVVNQNLPTSNFKTAIVPKAINIALALAGTVSVIVFVYAGVMLVVSQGNEEEITKFKNILIWSLVGLVFITMSYALVRGIMKLVFF